MQRRQRNVQKRVVLVQACCFANLNLLLFCRSRCHRRRRCLRTLISHIVTKRAYPITLPSRVSLRSCYPRLSLNKENIRITQQHQKKYAYKWSQNDHPSKRKPTFAPRSPGGPMYPRGPGDAYKGIVPLNLKNCTVKFPGHFYTAIYEIYCSLCR